MRKLLRVVGPNFVAGAVFKRHYISGFQKRPGIIWECEECAPILKKYIRCNGGTGTNPTGVIKSLLLSGGCKWTWHECETT